MILAVDVRRSLGPFTLDVAFAAPAGITALFGPSGSGKTLTLRTVAGLLRPDRGRVALGPRVLFDSEAGIDVPTRERRIGYVFQHYALFPHLTAAANVAYGLHALPAPARTARVLELLELVELSGLAARHPHELSGGQQQRIAIARALAPVPELLLLDEPFAAVDTFLRARLRDQLRAIHERAGVPMILVTHDLADVQHLAESLVVYGHGEVLQVGATADVLRSPMAAALGGP
ncbi:MAG TPA: ATP-binding cassette domain-containing protein [Candidatus Limnocylindria bacterium]